MTGGLFGTWPDGDSAGGLILQHLGYLGLSLLLAALIGLPIGLIVGHTRRGEAVVIGIANVLRSLPSLGLIVLLVILLSGIFTSDLAYFVPSVIVLVLLGVPPIMSSTYAGVRGVDPAAVDAARGMGMTPMGVALGVELPCALPLVLSGIRSATLQVVSTATIAAYVSLGGLGRLIIDGQAANDYAEMAAGAGFVAALALVLDLAIGLLSRALVSPGITEHSPLVRRRIALPSTRL